MLRRQFYYEIKPYLPWVLRNTIRSFFAKRKRTRFTKTWPIDYQATSKPANWLGWPDGKKFAVILTHDVEGQSGHDKCLQLMELEKEMGFVSSFNFIPEGEYTASKELRENLSSNGFEVGVHDLHHDGRLFHGAANFQSKAHRINRYLNDWGAKGFRGGFMLRELDWLHQLNIEYDLSTFDTDPFEPQPGDAGTIFPYWIPRITSSGEYASEPTFEKRPIGYIEMPYTLPQDSTLFLVLREKTPEIWINKTDWLVENQAMVLVNIHPDYMSFTASDGSISTYPSSHYRSLLNHIKNNYDGLYWNPLPREAASWARQSLARDA